MTVTEQKILPEKFVQTIINAHGAHGKKWIAELPNIIEGIEEGWRVKVQKPFQNLSYHFVAPCVCADKSEAVVKIGFPEAESPIFNESAMLKVLDGNGAVRFLEIDEKRYSLLLEKLTPGDHLKIIFQNDAPKAVQAAIKVLQMIVQEPQSNHSFIPLENWFKNFEKAENTNFPLQAVKKALAFYDELRTEKKFLLHGDFHHENILSATREPFLIIDPKGIVGELGYEISVFLNNHAVWLSSSLNLREKLNETIIQFSEAFRISTEDLRKWAFSQAVLSAWWTYSENGKNWKTDLALSEIWEI